MADNATAAARQRRYRLHKSGIHGECLPERNCAVNSASAPEKGAPISPREAIERELNRTVSRLDRLAAAIEGRPTDLELLAEARGQQRALVQLSAALGKAAAVSGSAAPVVPLAENPLESLRRRRAERGGAAEPAGRAVRRGGRAARTPGRPAGHVRTCVDLARPGL